MISIVLFNSLECSNVFGKEQGLGISLIEAAFMDASDRKINTWYVVYT